VDHVVVEDAEHVDEALDASVLGELLSLLGGAEVLDEGVQPELEWVNAVEADADERLVEPVLILRT
jgi:hypothetical protein